jgi:hypothetical protein
MLVGTVAGGATLGGASLPRHGRQSSGRLGHFVPLPIGSAAGECGAAIWMGRRIASPEMFPEAEMLPHLICSRPMFIGGAKDEADQHGGA